LSFNNAIKFLVESKAETIVTLADRNVKLDEAALPFSWDAAFLGAGTIVLGVL
jgi:hypothetical protein